MSYKYGAEIYNKEHIEDWSHLYRNMWFCREFAQRDIHSVSIQQKYAELALSVRVKGLNMRARTMTEQEGMAKFAKLLLPDQHTHADSISIWFDSLMDEDGKQVTPAREVYSLMLFYIKYLSVQMQDRVDFDRVCKSLIKRKHVVYHGIPDQQLGTALYFYSLVRYPIEMKRFRTLLSSGSGPGTAMRCLANLQEVEVGVPRIEGKFYRDMVDEWCSLFKPELRYTLDYHSKTYERLWYMPLLLQDVYAKVYDGDGKFDNVEYSEDEW